jgi:hypothetical protein
MQHLLKWASLVLALLAPFVPLASMATPLLSVEKSGGVPGFQSSEQLCRYLTFHMAKAQPGGWRFEPTAARTAPAPNRVEWRFKLDPYAGGEVRTLVRPYMETFDVHRPITIEARLCLNGRYQRLVEKKAIIQGGPDDPSLAAAVASLTQNLLRPAGAYHVTNNARTKASAAPVAPFATTH